MGGIWLTCCPVDGISRVRGEIIARDPEACLLRCGEIEALPGLARALSNESVAAALQFGCAQAVAGASAVGALAEAGVHDILVFTDQADPETIACCFHAGATEVITAGAIGPAAVSGSLTETCMGRETRTGRWESVPADDDFSPLTEVERRELARLEEDGASETVSPAAAHVSAALIDGEEPGQVWSPTASARPETVGSEGSDSAPDAAMDGERRVMSDGAPPKAGPAAPAAGSGLPAMDATESEASVPDSASARARPAPASSTPSPASVPTEPASGRSMVRAPMVTAISGRGGCGKTTLVASMAACAARAGLRAAVLDLDLMFGNLHDLLGVTSFKGFEGVSEHAEGDRITESDIEGAAMLIGPGLTLWGPCREAERAELMTSSAEQLIDVLRGIADVIFVDTSVAWGDTAAMAVEECDRCLVVGSAGASAVSSTKRAIELAQRMGVPTTRMTCVFNKVGAHGCDEEQALQFEMGISLRSRARIPDGGDEVAGMLSFGHVDSLVAGSSAFAKSVRSLTGDMLRELGCPVNEWLLEGDRGRGAANGRTRLRMPWKQGAGEVR